MKVFILEDDAVQRLRMEKMIKQIAHKQKIFCQEIFATSHPDKLLKAIDGTSEHQLYFLDLEIKNYVKKGLEVAQYIRKRDPYGTIVFVTTHTELAPKTFAYKVAAVDFIEKDQSETNFKKRIEECMLIANEYKKSKSVNIDTLSFDNKYTSFKIPFSEIYYFETSDIPHKLRLVTATKMIDFYGNLNEVVACDDRLFRCHNSYVVNLANAYKIDKTEKLLYFNDHICCFISRRLLKETEKRLKERHF